MSHFEEDEKMYKIGDRVAFKPIASTYGMGRHQLEGKTQVGTVVYVHPAQRYMVLQREVGGRMYRESISLRGGAEE